MLDSYLYGNVNRISPEAPVPVLNKNREDYKLGGAGNVALNCKALGANVVLISHIGEDENGKRVVGLLEQNDIKSFLVSDNKPTTVKQRIISGNTHMLRIDIEDTTHYKDENQLLLNCYLKEVEKADIIIISDYDKGLLHIGNITEIIQIAKDFNKIVCVDPKVNNFSLYKNVDLFKPNIKEARDGMKLNNIIDNGSLLRLIKSEMNIDSVMITMSDKGIIYKGDNELISESYPVEIADPCGCGDSVMAISSILKFLNIEEKLMLDISNLGGSMVCEHLGVIQIKKQELLDKCIQLGLK